MSSEIEVVADLDMAGRPAQVLNMAPVSTGDLARDPQIREIAAAMGRWVDNARGRGMQSNMFRRDRYLPPDNPYDQMKAGRDAVENDDIVAGVAEVTEAIAFPGLKWEADDADDADVFNQLSADLNLDGAVRAMWRDEFRYEQFVCAKLWGPVSYTVRGRTKSGNKRKKTVTFWAPKRLVTLDSLKCVPIGWGPLREDEMAWQATNSEIGSFDATITGEKIDPLMTSFFTEEYAPGEDEKAMLTNLGVDTTTLLKMNPDWVFRHTGTRADHELFASSRLKSVFALLDMKQQLMQSDRASLVGAANYILLIRKGSDAAPAKPEEIRNLQEKYNFLAKLPVIISDHRLDIDIIAPKLDFVLKESSYETIDRRILARLLGALSVGGGGAADGAGASSMIGGMISKVMENRRHMLKRTLEREIARAVVNHPKNAGIFEQAPSLVYTPRNVSIDTDQAYASALLALRTQREVSRETILEYLGLDQATEAQRMELEDEIYDDIFKTAIPFAAPGSQPNLPDQQGDGSDGKDGTGEADSTSTPNGTPESPTVSGRRGGRPKGGGEPSKSPAATAKPKTRNGNSSTKGQ